MWLDRLYFPHDTAQRLLREILVAGGSHGADDEIELAQRMKWGWC